MTTEASSRVTKSTVESTSPGLTRTSSEDWGMSGPLTGGTWFIAVRGHGDYLEITHNLKDIQEVFFFFSLLVSPSFKGT